MDYTKEKGRDDHGGILQDHPPRRAVLRDLLVGYAILVPIALGLGVSLFLQTDTATIRGVYVLFESAICFGYTAAILSGKWN
jgi:hypothetical protein